MTNLLPRGPCSLRCGRTSPLIPNAWLSSAAHTGASSPVTWLVSIPTSTERVRPGTLSLTPLLYWAPVTLWTGETCARYTTAHPQTHGCNTSQPFFRSESFILSVSLSRSAGVTAAWGFSIHMTRSLLLRPWLPCWRSHPSHMLLRSDTHADL